MSKCLLVPSDSEQGLGLRQYGIFRIWTAPRCCGHSLNAATCGMG